MIRKILFLLFFILFLNLSFLNKAFATFECTTRPTSLIWGTTTDTINLIIKSNNSFSTSGQYAISAGHRLNNPDGSDFTPTDTSTINVGNLAVAEGIFGPTTINSYHRTWKLIVSVNLKSDSGAVPACTAEIPVTVGCQVEILTPTDNLTPSTQNLNFKATFAGEPKDQYDVLLMQGNSYPPILTFTKSGAELTSGTTTPNFSLPPGTGYNIRINDNTVGEACRSDFFSISGSGGNIGCTPGDSSTCPDSSWQCLPDPANPERNTCQTLGSNINNPNNPYSKTAPPPLPCDASGIDGKGNCKSVATGLGFSISTDVGKFITSLLGILLSISGGIAVLLIIIAGYRLMISQGNPEKIQPAREQLTAAIVGLLFIIFSLVIIQVIGYDILHIPGFGQ